MSSRKAKLQRRNAIKSTPNGKKVIEDGTFSPKKKKKTRLPYNEDTHNQKRRREMLVEYGVQLAGSTVDFELMLLDIIDKKLPRYELNECACALTD
jgi:hypothetical protein